MTKEAPHLGIMMWTRGPNEDSTRPMAGSAAHEAAYAEWAAKREADLLTPEGQKWLERHGAI